MRICSILIIVILLASCGANRSISHYEEVLERLPQIVVDTIIIEIEERREEVEDRDTIIEEKSRENHLLRVEIDKLKKQLKEKQTESKRRGTNKI